MKQLQPYLIFPGTCEAALRFYTACFGGTITMLHRYARSPLDVAEAIGRRVFNAVFEAEGVVFRAADILPGHAHQTGTNICLVVRFSVAEEQGRVYTALSDGGRVQMALPAGGGVGIVEDRYGIRWMLILGTD